MKQITITLLALFVAQFAIAATPTAPVDQWPATIHVTYHCDDHGKLDLSQWTVTAFSAQDPYPGAYARFHAATDSNMFISNDTLYVQVPQVREDWPTRAFPIGHVSTESAVCVPSDNADGHNGYVSSVLPVKLNQIVTADLQMTGEVCAPGVRNSYVINSLIVHIDGMSYPLHPATCD